jgi:hypothetical protein
VNVARAVVDQPTVALARDLREIITRLQRGDQRRRQVMRMDVDDPGRPSLLGITYA